MALFRPAWQSQNEQKAVSAVQQITDINKLLEIILAEGKELSNWANRTDCSKAVRIAAVQKISDEGILKRIADCKTSNCVREAALRLISDKGFLCDFVKKSEKDEPLRQFALPLLKSEEELLLEVALHAGYTSVRNKAAQMLARQENIIQILKHIRIFKTDQAPFVREMFSRIDEAARLQICLETRDDFVREVGETALYDKSLLITLARQTGYFSPKNAGILKSLTQNELYFCCTKCYDIEKTLLILDVLWDSSLLLKVADDDKWSLRENGDKVIRRAISRITNQNFIERAAAERHAGFEINHTSLVLELLLERVENQQILAQIAKNTRVDSLCRIISKKLTDIELLYDVAKNGQRAAVFESIIPSITDPMLLAYIASRDEIYVGFSIDAVGTYTDVEAHIRSAAKERLMELGDNARALDYIAKNKRTDIQPERRNN